VAQQTGYPLAVNHVLFEYFTIGGTGALDSTVDYTYADTVLLVWIAKGQCTFEQFSAEQCQYVASSFAGGKPRKVTAAGQTAGTYTHIVGNFGPKDEGISYQVVFTQTTAGTPPSAASVSTSGKQVFVMPAPDGGLRH
jgi:hypothetical protein